MVNESDDKIAIIMPAYNCSGTIKRSIDSVLAQTYDNWHLYIINDCSTDDLFKVLLEYHEDVRITIINNNENIGAANSRNKGLEASKERYISFLDSDDEWFPSKLEFQIKEIRNGKNICVTEYQYLSSKITPVEWKRKSITKNEFLKKKYRVCFSSLLHKRMEGLYFESVGHEDFLYIYKLIECYGEVAVVNVILVNYFELMGSLSSNKKKAALWHFKILRKISINPGFIFVNFIYYIINGLRFRALTK